ncbi:NAD(P)/FAD-dependent oxidoreductase [Paractinoplanes rishiriensis]|uniref:NAD(P)/FAD-dependent oxidoreductase n=1 Tax=Paractinoplanes rishiriensis TaxID=1050105 RepID=UPI0019405094|nr:NAD(P)/FAD-dependent oxidoreductase [Actinoplanes rishiriensis]
MREVDVVVVGAGLAGLQTGRLLAQRGLGVLVVERRRSLSAGLRTTGIFVRRTLDDFDVPEHLLGPGVRDVLLYPPSRRAPIRLTSDRDEYRVADMAGVYRHARCAAERAGAEVRLGVRYAGVGNGVVRLEGTDPVAARFIVGADGARSRVARDLGLDQNRRFLVGAEIVHPIASGASEPAFHCVLDPRVAPGYLGWVVDDGHSAHVGVAGYPHAMRTGVRHLLDRFVADAPGQAAATGPIERRGGPIPVGGVLRRLASPTSSPAGLLVGDAAGAVSPLTAGGLDPCLRMSEFAAAIIVEYLCDGDQHALRRYDGRTLRAGFRGRLLLRRVLAGVRSVAAAEAAVAALRSPTGRRAAARILFGDGSFPDVR